jgi:hypothetical protein
VPPGDADAARAELDIPLSSFLFRLTLDFSTVPSAPHVWQGVVWELIGAYPPPETTFQRYRMRLPVFADWPDDQHPHSVVVWRRRVYFTAARYLYFEWRWHPLTGETHALVTPPTVPPPEVAGYWQRGLTLMRRTERRGRRPGPDGFEDAQEFEDTVVALIRKAHANGQGTKQERIATLLQPILAHRRRDIGSPSSVDVDTQSTKRLIRKHLSCPWHVLVKKALQTQ